MIVRAQDDKFMVARHPCLMEDEGNWHILAICDTRVEIAEFCKQYVAECRGYFTLSNLVYFGSHFSPGGSFPEKLREWLPVNIREFMEDINELSRSPRETKA